MMMCFSQTLIPVPMVDPTRETDGFHQDQHHTQTPNLLTRTTLHQLLPQYFTQPAMLPIYLPPQQGATLAPAGHMVIGSASSMAYGYPGYFSHAMAAGGNDHDARHYASLLSMLAHSGASTLPASAAPRESAMTTGAWME